MEAMIMLRRLALVAAVGLAGTTAVVRPASPAQTGARGAAVDPADFVRTIDNPWYPLRPGTTYRFRSPDGATRDVVTVTRRTKTILGVRCVVVSDNVYENGRLTEPTSDWYAQDRRGNVWYFGEATAELDKNGKVKTREGSWEAGVHGAKAGIVMSGRPRVGQSFRQEYYKGHAEDHFAIETLSASVHTPYVSSRHAMRTREWSPLEPGATERKYYVRGVGLVAVPADDIVLVSVEKR
jgi:hypothetical protein